MFEDFILGMALLIGVNTTFSNMALAMYFTGMQETMSFIQIPKLEISGDINGKVFTLNGEKLKLVPYLSNTTDKYVKLMSQDGRKVYLSFPVEKCPFFRVYKIYSDNQDFLLILEGKQAVSDSLCTGAWLVGKYKGNYTSFISIDTLKNAGLLFQTIVPAVNNNEISLIGIARDRDCRDGSYKGHLVRDYSRGYCKVNTAALFWDNNAQWFGIRVDD